jgi:hypothetical protein
MARKPKTLRRQFKPEEQMTIPGFTAETSLYKMSVHYRSIGTSGEAVGVRPQYIPLAHTTVCGPCQVEGGPIGVGGYVCFQWCHDVHCSVSILSGGQCFTGPSYARPCPDVMCPGFGSGGNV